MTIRTGLEIVLRNDRAVVISGLSLVVVLAALYTIAGIGMSESAITMTRFADQMADICRSPAQWTAGYAAILFLMWWIMMIAMMIPSAAPAILTYGKVMRQKAATQGTVNSTFIFVLGYLVAWSGFALLAVILLWILGYFEFLGGAMQIISPTFAGAVLIGAGLYQLTPVKDACLKHCQHPMIFMMTQYKPGRKGAFQMGLRHGAHCLGCCWVLMLLMFVGGVMNLVWMGGLTLYVLIEKLAARQRWVTTYLGWGLVGGGILVIARAYLP